MIIISTPFYYIERREIYEMAKFRPVKIYKSQLSTFPIVEGQFIVCIDSPEQYLDLSGGIRKQITDILRITSEEKENMLAPLNHFYFIEDTNELYFYNNGWTLLSHNGVFNSPVNINLSNSSLTGMHIESTNTITSLGKSHFYSKNDDYAIYINTDNSISGYDGNGIKIVNTNSSNNALDIYLQDGHSAINISDNSTKSVADPIVKIYGAIRPGISLIGDTNNNYYAGIQLSDFQQGIYISATNSSKYQTGVYITNNSKSGSGIQVFSTSNSPSTGIYIYTSTAGTKGLIVQSYATTSTNSSNSIGAHFLQGGYGTNVFIENTNNSANYNLRIKTASTYGIYMEHNTSNSYGICMNGVYEHKTWTGIYIGMWYRNQTGIKLYAYGGTGTCGISMSTTSYSIGEEITLISSNSTGLNINMSGGAGLNVYAININASMIGSTGVRLTNAEGSTYGIYINNIESSGTNNNRAIYIKNSSASSIGIHITNDSQQHNGSNYDGILIENTCASTYTTGLNIKHHSLGHGIYMSVKGSSNVSDKISGIFIENTDASFYGSGIRIQNSITGAGISVTNQNDSGKGMYIENTCATGFGIGLHIKKSCSSATDSVLNFPSLFIENETVLGRAIYVKDTNSSGHGEAIYISTYKMNSNIIDINNLGSSSVGINITSDNIESGTAININHASSSNPAIVITNDTTTTTSTNNSILVYHRNAIANGIYVIHGSNPSTPGGTWYSNCGIRVDNCYTAGGCGINVNGNSDYPSIQINAPVATTTGPPLKILNKSYSYGIYLIQQQTSGNPRHGIYIENKSTVTGTSAGPYAMYIANTGTSCAIYIKHDGGSTQQGAALAINSNRIGNCLSIANNHNYTVDDNVNTNETNAIKILNKARAGLMIVHYEEAYESAIYVQNSSDKPSLYIESVSSTSTTQSNSISISVRDRKNRGMYISNTSSYTESQSLYLVHKANSDAMTIILNRASTTSEFMPKSGINIDNDYGTNGIYIDQGPNTTNGNAVYINNNGSSHALNILHNPHSTGTGAGICITTTRQNSNGINIIGGSSESTRANTGINIDTTGFNYYGIYINCGNSTVDTMRGLKIEGNRAYYLAEFLNTYGSGYAAMRIQGGVLIDKAQIGNIKLTNKINDHVSIDTSGNISADGKVISGSVIHLNDTSSSNTQLDFDTWSTSFDASVDLTISNCNINSISGTITISDIDTFLNGNLGTSPEMIRIKSTCILDTPDNKYIGTGYVCTYNATLYPSGEYAMFPVNMKPIIVYISPSEDTNDDRPYIGFYIDSTTLSTINNNDRISFTIQYPIQQSS